MVLYGDDIGENIILVPEEEDENGAKFFTYDNTAKLDIEFVFNERGVEMIYERYRYRKTSITNLNCKRT